MAAVLAIVVAVGDAHSASTQSLLAAAESALPAETSLRLLVVPDPLQVDAVRIEQRLAARAVVTLVWQPAPGGLSAALRFHVAGDPGWTERIVQFAAADTPNERGRMLGFAIASMWPEKVEPPPRAGSGPRSTENAPAPANDNAAAPTSPRLGPAARSPEQTAASEPGRSPTAPTEPPTLEGSGGAASPGQTRTASAGRFAVGLAAVGATGIGGPAQGIGGSAEFVWHTSETIVLRGTVAVRGGPLPELPGSAWVGAVGPGVEWWPHLLVVTPRWSVGVRGDLLWLGHRVRREAVVDPANPSASLPPETQSRMLPAVDLMLRTAVALGPSVQLLLGAGVELAAGRTDVRTGTDRVVRATVPIARGITDIGVRYSFY